MEVSRTAVVSLLDHFSPLGDPRQSDRVVYPLPEILLVVLCGTLAGPQSIVEILHWASQTLAFLRGVLPFVRDVPSHDTLCDVLNARDAASFSAWVPSLADTAPEIVAIDGKTSRNAHARAVLVEGYIKQSTEPVLDPPAGAHRHSEPPGGQQGGGEIIAARQGGLACLLDLGLDHGQGGRTLRRRFRQPRDSEHSAAVSRLKPAEYPCMSRHGHPEYAGK